MEFPSQPKTWRFISRFFLEGFLVTLLESRWIEFKFPSVQVYPALENVLKPFATG